MTCATCTRPSQGPLCGRHYALWVRGVPQDSPQSVCAISGCPKPHFALGFCRGHHARHVRGYDIMAPLHPRKVKGARYHPKSSGQPMRPVMRLDEAEALWSIVGNAEAGQGRTGGVCRPAAWARENAEAMRLGAPDIWQAIADEALERAWADLMSGSYAERLASRLPHRSAAPTSPAPIQSPLVAAVAGERKAAAGQSERRAS